MRTVLAATTIALSLAATPVLAQNTGATPPSQSGLVNVNLNNVRVEIAKNMNIDVEKVPVNIQLPVNVAANVCGLDVNALSVQGQGSKASCTATNSQLAMQYVTNTVK